MPFWTTQSPGCSSTVAPSSSSSVRRPLITAVVKGLRGVHPSGIRLEMPLEARNLSFELLQERVVDASASSDLASGCIIRRTLAQPPRLVRPIPPNPRSSGRKVLSNGASGPRTDFNSSRRQRVVSATRLPPEISTRMVVRTSCSDTRQALTSCFSTMEAVARLTQVKFSHRRRGAGRPEVPRGHRAPSTRRTDRHPAIHRPRRTQSLLLARTPPERFPVACG